MEVESSLDVLKSSIHTSPCMSIFADRVAKNAKKKMESSPKMRSPYKMLITNEDECFPKESKPEKSHACNSKCQHEEYRFSIYANEKNIHMCMKGDCSALGNNAAHEEQICPETSVYICTKGWTSHLCDNLCCFVEDIKINGGSISEKGFICPISKKTLYRSNGCALTDSEKRTYLDETVQIWKDRLSGGFLPIDPSLHVCDTSLEFAPGAPGTDEDPLLTEEEMLFKGLRVSKRKLNITDVQAIGGCELDQIRAKVYDSSLGERHLCVAGLCESLDDRNMHWIQIYDICHLHVCKKTGIPHFCGEICQRKTLTKDGLFVCPLTGYVDDIPVARDHLYSGEQRLKSDIDTRKINQDSSKLDRDDLESVLQGMIPKRSSDKKLEYLYLAIQKISSVFSEEQLKAEETLMQDSIAKEVNAQMTRYVNKSSQSKRVLCFQEMITLVQNHRKKKDIPTRMSLSDNDRHTLVLMYAKKCIILWYIVRTRTRIGKECQAAFGFKDFILPALSILQSGFCVDIQLGDNNVYQEVIIEPDSMLAARCLQNGHRLTRRMDSSPNNGRRVEGWSGKKGAQLDRIRYQIEEALMTAIRVELKSPEELRINSVDYDSINLDQVLGTSRIRTPEGVRKKKK